MHIESALDVIDVLVKVHVEAADIDHTKPPYRSLLFLMRLQDVVVQLDLGRSVLRAIAS